MVGETAMPRGNGGGGGGSGPEAEDAFSHGFSVSASSRTGIASTHGVGPPSSGRWRWRHGVVAGRDEG